MEAQVRARYVRSSPRKLRQVVDLIRDKNVSEAVDILHFTPKRAARIVEKALRSAVANLMFLEGSRKIDIDKVKIKKAMVDSGPIARRFQPGPMGRALRIRKRYSHITLIVGEE